MQPDFVKVLPSLKLDPCVLCSIEGYFEAFPEEINQVKRKKAIVEITF